MARITFDGVTKRFADGTVAVDRLNLEIADGEFVILVGPSGCGKSTTLNMVAGLEEISDGELRIDDELVNAKPPGQRDIAMVFQSYALYPHMTVRRNLAFPLELAKLDRQTIDRKVNAAAELLGLVDLLDRKPAQLSGGQRQRVAMGRAIVRSPRAFLMDEPLSNLDARLRVQMRGQIARLQKRLNTTTLYVTHDQVEAMTLGDRVVVMRDGVVQQIAAPQTLYDQPKNLFVAGFIGSPPMNLFPAEIDNGHLRCELGDLPLPAATRSESRKVIVGLRPEQFTDAALDDSPGVTHTGIVDYVESMGAERHVYVKRAADSGEPLVARLPNASQVRAGETVRLRFHPERLTLFDATTGENLASAP